MTMFTTVPSTIPSPEPAQQLDLPDAEIYYWPRFFSVTDADILLTELKNELAWHQGDVKVFGRWHKIPRLQAWHGEPGKDYQYSGHTLAAEQFTPTLRHIKKILETGPWRFNSVLGNWYRDGDDRMGWHSDNEPELGRQPVIASLSLGAQRDFQFKHRYTKERFDLPLLHGSLLVMAGDTQNYWLHGLPRRKKVEAERVNLTYRYII